MQTQLCVTLWVRRKKEEADRGAAMRALRPGPVFIGSAGHTQVPHHVLGFYAL